MTVNKAVNYSNCLKLLILFTFVLSLVTELETADKAGSASNDVQKTTA
jgi:hypothetical protein